MPNSYQLWMPAVLSLFGALIVVVFTAWLNTRALSAQMDALRAEVNGKMDAVRAEMNGKMDVLRAEMKQGFAELRLEFHERLSALEARIERVEEQRPGLLQTP
ncbi:MAG TPA: hypothetical protein VG206_14440 [Terriglobia bacterium]|nr:hypothetical protein [Terriglobia bacterium]